MIGKHKLKGRKKGEGERGEGFRNTGWQRDEQGKREGRLTVNKI